ncbi:MAG: DinB family protein [Acidobacteriaceae bacterium]
MEREPEPWLRGTHRDLPAVVRAVIHALELAREDGERWCRELSDEQMYLRPAGIAPVAFQLRHVVRSLDRLLTYAEGRQLSAEQMAGLKTEMDAGATREAVLEEFSAGIEAAIARVKRFAGANLEEARSVGRKGLPTTVGGLLVHCADHTQRHAGQIVTTAGVLAAPAGTLRVTAGPERE